MLSKQKPAATLEKTSLVKELVDELVNDDVP